MTFPFYYFRSGYRRIKRFILWFPIIWHDEDWDSAYLLEIMRFKVSRIRKEIAKNKSHVGYEKRIRQMNVVEELLKRFADDSFYFYLSDELKNIQKYGKCSCPEETLGFEPYYSSSGEHIGSTLIDLSCNYCKSMKTIWYKSQNAKEADFEFLFNHLKKHVRRWWD